MGSSGYEQDDDDKNEEEEEEEQANEDSGGEDKRDDDDENPEEEEEQQTNEDDEDEDEDDRDDDQQLGNLMAEIEGLHTDFNSKVSTRKSVLQPSWLDLSEALEKVYELAVFVPELCPKDRAAYWKHEVESSTGTVDEALSRLKQASHAAYTAIQAKESQLDAEQETVRKSLAITQDLIDRLGQVERKSDLFVAKMRSRRTNSEATLAKRTSSHQRAESKYKIAFEEAQAAMERMKRKNEVNSNIFKGLGDWFSRKDDQFNLALSLGIGEEQEREKDRQTRQYYQTELEDEADHVQSARTALEQVNHLLRRIDAANQTLESTAARTQAFKSEAIETSSELGKRKDALQQVASKLTDIENTMQNIDEEMKLLTVGRMSVEILAVLRASARYQAFEIGLKDVNRKIWDVLVNNNDWQSSFDEDEEVEPQYNEVKQLLS